MNGPEPGHLLRLPHDVLINLIVRLEARDLGRLAATCRLLQYGQSSPQQAPNPVEDALRLRAGLSGWSRTLPVESRGVVRYFLRLAWQHGLEFHAISASHFDPISLFVDSSGSLRSCGVELQENEDTRIFLREMPHAGDPGLLGFGRDWHIDSNSDHLRKEEPTLVPATQGVRMRSVVIGKEHVFALTEEGQVYIWGAPSSASRAPQIPTLFEEVSQIKVRSVAVGAFHSAALTDEGKLYTWLHDEKALPFDPSGAAGAGYPLPDLGDIKDALFHPQCVKALLPMHIVSVAAGFQHTIVATDTGIMS